MERTTWEDVEKEDIECMWFNQGRKLNSVNTGVKPFLCYTNLLERMGVRSRDGNPIH